MDEIKDLENLRIAAQSLRQQPDAIMLQRIRAGVAQRIASPPSLADQLASWFRPVALTVTALIIAMGIAFIQTSDTISPVTIATADVQQRVEQEILRELQ